MSIADKDRMQRVLVEIDKKINSLNNQKITALFDAMGLRDREDTPKISLTGKASSLLCLAAIS